MAIAIKRYKDGTYTPLFNPLARRIDYGTPEERKKLKYERKVKKAEEKKAAIYKRRYERQYEDAKLYEKAGLKNPYGFKFDN